MSGYMNADWSNADTRDSQFYMDISNNGYDTNNYGANNYDSNNYGANNNRGYNNQCYIVCPNNPQPRPPRPTVQPRPNLGQIANRIMNLNINQARSIYANIRVVVQNGHQQIVTADFRRDRINVETRNNRITRILGFY